MDTEKRNFERYNLDNVAYVDGRTPYVVMDVSKMGARLQLADENYLPDKFMISLSPELQRWCLVKWRNAGQVGVEFISCPFDPFDPFDPFAPVW